jgi:hypothetical protein
MAETQPTLNSFISYNTETVVNPLYAAFLAGSTYKPPTFNGVSGAASTNPGGLFGWLIYARTEASTPAKGLSSDPYLVYTRPAELINDLNALKGITACLLSTSDSQGGTFGFFKAVGLGITGTTFGNDFYKAISYLAYGGSLVIAGTCGGFNTYESDTSNKLDVLLGYNASADEARYVESNPHIMGIFASLTDGAGYTAQPFDSLFSSANLVTGATVANRIINIAGKNNRSVITSTLLSGSEMKANTNLIADVAGAFTRAKNNNTIYFSVAGVDNGNLLNGNVLTPILWNDETEKNKYKKNRVNFYSVSGLNKFMGLDLVGATAGATSSYTSDERIGVSKLKTDIESNIQSILLKYVFDVNTATTRSAITAEISYYISGLSQYLDSTYTQIFCDDGNNTDYDPQINVKVVVKPLLASETFDITVVSQS